MANNFTAEWLKGKKDDTPDALSRNPVSDPQPHEMLAKYNIHNCQKNANGIGLPENTSQVAS